MLSKLIALFTRKPPAIPKRRPPSREPMAAVTGPAARTTPRDRDLTLQPEGQRWLQQLPASVRPQALPVRYPRICNHLALLWADEQLVDNYFDSLLVDNRGSRTGFPPEVAAELITLHNYFNNTRAKGPGNKAWDDRTLAVGDR
jgi:hypothetical protein